MSLQPQDNAATVTLAISLSSNCLRLFDLSALAYGVRVLSLACMTPTTLVSTISAVQLSHGTQPLNKIASINLTLLPMSLCNMTR